MKIDSMALGELRRATNGMQALHRLTGDSSSDLLSLKANMIDATLDVLAAICGDWDEDTQLIQQLVSERFKKIQAAPLRASQLRRAAAA